MTECRHPITITVAAIGPMGWTPYHTDPDVAVDPEEHVAVHRTVCRDCGAPGTDVAILRRGAKVEQGSFAQAYGPPPE